MHLHMLPVLHMYIYSSGYLKESMPRSFFAKTAESADYQDLLLVPKYM